MEISKMKKVLLTASVLLFILLSACTSNKSDKKEQIEAHLEVAEAEYRQNEGIESWKEAWKEADKALNLSIKYYGEDSPETGEVYLKRGYYSYYIEDSFTDIRTAERIFEKSGNMEGMAKTYYVYGREYKAAGDYNKAKSAAEKALNYCDQCQEDMSKLKFHIYILMGNLENLEGSHKENLEYCKKAEIFWNQLSGDEKNEEAILLYHNMGICYVNMKEYRLALESFEKVYEYESATGYDIQLQHCVSESYSHGGISYAFLGEYDKAIEYLNMALDSLDKCSISEKREYGLVYGFLATMYTTDEMCDYDKAVEYWLNACKYFSEQPEPNADDLASLKNQKDNLKNYFEKSGMAEDQDFETWYEENMRRLQEE